MGHDVALEHHASSPGARLTDLEICNVSHDRMLPVRLYWSDGRVEDLKNRLDVADHPEIIRTTGEQHVHFAFNGHTDADGFAVYEQRSE